MLKMEMDCNTGLLSDRVAFWRCPFFLQVYLYRGGFCRFCATRRKESFFIHGEIWKTALRVEHRFMDMCETSSRTAVSTVFLPKHFNVVLLYEKFDDRIRMGADGLNRVKVEQYSTDVAEIDNIFVWLAAILKMSSTQQRGFVQLRGATKDLLTPLVALR